MIPSRSTASELQEVLRAAEGNRNLIADSLPAIVACCRFEKKPAIEVNFIKDGQLAIF